MDNPKKIFENMNRTREEMEHIMQHMFGQSLPLFRRPQAKWRPNVDVFEYKDRVVVVAELAGVEREDVSVIFNDGRLFIRGIRRDNTPCEGKKYCQMEINYNEFERVILMPENVETEKISAKLNNGLMIIRAPKITPDEPKSLQVEIG